MARISSTWQGSPAEPGRVPRDYMGAGEFDIDGEASRHAMRQRFLAAVGEQIPDVLRDLQSNVLPLHCQAFGLAIEDEPFDEYMRRENRELVFYRTPDKAFFCGFWGAIIPVKGQARPDAALRAIGDDPKAYLGRLDAALRAWEERWHLREVWVTEAALEQLRRVVSCERSAVPRPGPR